MSFLTGIHVVLNQSLTLLDSLYVNDFVCGMSPKTGLKDYFAYALWGMSSQIFSLQNIFVFQYYHSCL